MVTSAQLVAEMSISVNNKSPSRDYPHPKDQTRQMTVFHKFCLLTLYLVRMNLEIHCVNVYFIKFVNLLKNELSSP